MQFNQSTAGGEKPDTTDSEKTAETLDEKLERLSHLTAALLRSDVDKTGMYCCKLCKQLIFESPSKYIYEITIFVILSNHCALTKVLKPIPALMCVIVPGPNSIVFIVRTYIHYYIFIFTGTLKARDVIRIVNNYNLIYNLHFPEEKVLEITQRCTLPDTHDVYIDELARALWELMKTV